MGSVCDRIEKYKPKESLYKMNDEDYKARDITINYTGLNSSFLLEDIFFSQLIKRLLLKAS